MNLISNKSGFSLPLDLNIAQSNRRSIFIKSVNPGIKRASPSVCSCLRRLKKKEALVLRFLSFIPLRIHVRIGSFRCESIHFGANRFWSYFPVFWLPCSASCHSSKWAARCKWNRPVWGFYVLQNCLNSFAPSFMWCNRSGTVTPKKLRSLVLLYTGNKAVHVCVHCNTFLLLVKQTAPQIQKPARRIFHDQQNHTSQCSCLLLL